MNKNLQIDKELNVEKLPLSEKFSATKNAPVAALKRVGPETAIDATNCETNLQIGVFFDGTGNNRTLDSPKKAQSNVARLSSAYSTAKEDTCFAVYIPGLGTPFPEIAEDAETTFGAAFGTGGESRVLFAILFCLDVFSLATTGHAFFQASERKALCRADLLGDQDLQVLGRFGLGTRLVGGGELVRRYFFERQIQKMRQVLSNKKAVVITEAFVDVFGFSRGAAEARVFCHWLKEIMDDSRIVDIPFRFRFVGLMDTVASVGVWEGISNTVFGTTGGHSDWAKSRYLHILPEVENCVHFVAMHELRKNFPLDTVALSDTAMPPNCHEYAYPGTHSDIGGGYSPGDLGICSGSSSAAGDAMKLSQITLSHMYECALAAGVPLSQAGQNDSFAVSEEVVQDFNKFLDVCSTEPRLLSDWALPYYLWRWRQCNTYEALNHVVKARGKHRQYLIDANAMFKHHAQWIYLRGDVVTSKAYVEKARSHRGFNANNNEYRQEEINYLEPEAAALYWRVTVQNKETLMPIELGEFFDKYVHDSVAGFREKLVEGTGHWRYRRLFRGEDEPRLSDATEYTNPGANA